MTERGLRKKLISRIGMLQAVDLGRDRKKNQESRTQSFSTPVWEVNAPRRTSRKVNFKNGLRGTATAQLPITARFGPTPRKQLLSYRGRGVPRNPRCSTRVPNSLKMANAERHLGQISLTVPQICHGSRLANFLFVCQRDCVCFAAI